MIKMFNHRSILLAILIMGLVMSLSAADADVLILHEAASTGDYDFIELHNTSDSAIEIRDRWEVTDDLEGAADGDDPLVIPIGTVIPAKGYLLLVPYKRSFTSKRPEDLPTGAVAAESFMLGSSDSVTLTHEGLIVDRLSWESRVNSIGRSPDDITKISQLLLPTPGEKNRDERIYTGYSPLVINEICSNGLDYIELYNRSSEDLIAGADEWTLSDIGRTNIFTIPEGMSIPAKERLVIYPDLVRLPLSASKNSLSSLRADRFGLGDKDTLFLRYQGELVESRTWTMHVVSTGRFPDGSDRWVADMLLTPGRENKTE